MIASGGQDRHLDAGAERRQPGDDEEVHVRERQAADDAARADRRLVEEAEVDPPQRSCSHEPGGRGQSRAGHPAHLLDTENDGEHGLSEDDQRE